MPTQRIRIDGWLQVDYEDFIPPIKDDGTFEQLTPYEKSLLYTPKDHPREFI